VVRGASGSDQLLPADDDVQLFVAVVSFWVAAFWLSSGESGDARSGGGERLLDRQDDDGGPAGRCNSCVPVCSTSGDRGNRGVDRRAAGPGNDVPFSGRVSNFHQIQHSSLESDRSGLRCICTGAVVERARTDARASNFLLFAPVSQQIFRPDAIFPAP